jgi:prolipoprotein diacylglyceryltransferase
MYPNLYFFLQEALNIEHPWNFTQYINSFGFLVALSFVASAVVLTLELKRKEKQGLLSPKEEIIRVGEPAKPMELLFNLVFGFIVGYKILGVFMNGADVNPQEYIFSSRGSWFGGILLGGLFSGLKYWEKKKQQLAKPEERVIRIWPHERVGDMTIMAAVFGFLGAKVFDNLENWDRFIQNPIANLLSPSGLTFYGGLIVAGIAILWYARKKSISWRHLVDAFGPTMMIAYALGRIGCQVSGDGDWGIFNTAYTLNTEGQVVLATDGQFTRTLMANQGFSQYLVREFGSIENIPRTHFEGPSFLPNWFWAYHYPHNVNEIGTPIEGCTGNYCMQLNPLVFPTPLYEFIACTLLFFVLWYFRKKIKIPGRLFALYLVLNGAERFLVEKIRVNSTYDIAGFHPTQAELISSMLVIAGIGIWWWMGQERFRPKTES